MDALYAGVGGAMAARPRVSVAHKAVTPVSNVSVPVAEKNDDLHRPLPEVRAVAQPSSMAETSTARFITFEEAGIRVPFTKTEVATASNTIATASKPRFATFQELGMISAPSTVAAAAVSSAVISTKPRFATFEALGMTPPLAYTTLNTGVTKMQGDSFACHVCKVDEKRKSEMWCAKKDKKDKKSKKDKKKDKKAKKKKSKDSESDSDAVSSSSSSYYSESDSSDSDMEMSRGAGDMKRSPTRTKETARRYDDAPAGASASTLFDMDTRTVINARSVELAPPSGVTGEAYAVSIKGVKRALKVVRGKASSGGPAFVPFNKDEELGTQGLNADQIAMLVTVEASNRQAVGDKPLSVLNDRTVYEPILPVGARQSFQFRFAGKRLVPVKVSRPVHKFRIKEGKPLAGFKVVHVGGLGNVVSKKKLLKKSKRKGGSKGASTTIYKGQPITLTFRNLRSGRDSTVTVDVPLEVTEASSYPGSSSVWYVALDGATGPAMLVMLFERQPGLDARLSDLLFLYAPDVSIKANATQVQLLASERYLATQIGALIDEIVISGYEGSQANLDVDTEELMANADHASFSHVLHTLQSIVSAPSAGDMSSRASEQLKMYVGALSACVHAHSGETTENFDIPNPAELAASAPSCIVNSDETSASGAEFAHTLAEVASDLAALKLDAHAVTIRASALYEAVFGHLQCGVHLAGHLADMDTALDTDSTSVDLESAADAEAQISNLAVFTMAHIVGHMAVQTKTETHLNAFWNAASTANTDALNYEHLIASHFA